MSSGDRIVEVARQHLGEQYIFGARAPMNNPNWIGPWDYAEFFVVCL